MFRVTTDTFIFLFIRICFLFLVASASFAQDKGPLPEFTYKGIALHPDELSDTLMDELVHPTIIKTEGRVTNPLGTYYMYYSPHKHVAIGMAYSNSIRGPWTEYQESPVIEGSAAPDIRWIEEKGKFYLWAHSKNSKTDVWTSDDGLQFEYLGLSIRADLIGTRNATYTRVYEYPLERFGSKYIMLYSGYIEERGIRCIWLAHSMDAEQWVQLKDPLVEPVEGENHNIYGPALLRYDHRNFIVYQDSATWRGGNIKYVEMDSVLSPVGSGGTRFLLMDPPPGPPLNDRYRGAELYLENDTFHMYSSASRSPRILVYANAQAVPGQGGADTIVIRIEKMERQLRVYPNPFGEHLIIDAPYLSSGFVVTLYDVSGRIHTSRQLNAGTRRIYTDHLRNGLYILEITDLNHTILHRQKLIRYK